ncbi:hypothetical protein LINGRAHAP2_LOCUS1532, partial [Linum grandiflorum]
MVIFLIGGRGVKFYRIWLMMIKIMLFESKIMARQKLIVRRGCGSTQVSVQWRLFPRFVVAIWIHGMVTANSKTKQFK